ncbi:MAG: carboxypeptidase regulatory-like protein [Ferruginibacter sp.]|uniref:carboxypeptidase-like regulatory domain-containing protein n=1 Tax=Ferruginibacter sp. TaxID=1940288 RepID=UPI002659B858|nr:carboxypeptidase-like regulatory domain-containing protein [Ferruginibacter sp.]MDB5278878.1 carboxypeptidase regulatory-like protein [Ferruginibacter sp.]
MTTDNPPSTKTVSVTTYLIISAISLIVASGIGYYYLHYMKQGGSEKMDDRVFYLILVLFGMAASALIFGIMNSYATLKGIESNVTYKFTGPVVGVILTVLGGFMIPKGSSDQMLTVRIFDEDKNPITKGRVTLTFPHYQREASVNEKGMVVFPEIPYDQLRNNIAINVVSDGYMPVNIDTLLPNFDPVSLTLAQAKIIRLAGTVKDAADRPIRDVDITVDGTPYATKTTNDGSFQIPLPDYHFGDRVTVVTAHPAYEDKQKMLNITSGEIDNIEFVLNPLPISNPTPTNNAKHKKK